MDKLDISRHRKMRGEARSVRFLHSHLGDAYTFIISICIGWRPSMWLAPRCKRNLEYFEAEAWSGVVIICGADKLRRCSVQ